MLMEHFLHVTYPLPIRVAIFRTIPSDLGEKGRKLIK